MAKQVALAVENMTAFEEIAALSPPVGRTLLVAKLDEQADYAGAGWDLATNRWADGTVAPEGHRLVERFHLDGTTPVWHFALADALIEKRIWMEPGANTTYVRYFHGDNGAGIGASHQTSWTGVVTKLLQQSGA